jgi:HNH/ENDO VII superfamily nuclease with conserved GHE residues
MLQISAGSHKLIIVSRSEIGRHGKRYALQSESEIRNRIAQACRDGATRAKLRSYCGSLAISNVSDAALPERIARLASHGPLAVFLIPDTSIKRISGTREQSETPRLAANPTPAATHHAAPAGAPTPAGAPRPAFPAAASTSSAATSAAPAGATNVVELTILQRLELIVPRAAQSERLSAEAKTQLKAMLSDPVQQAMFVSTLALWLASHLTGVGEMIDILLICAGAIMAGVGMAFAFKAIVDGAHLISEFATIVRNAQTEEDIDKAADVLAQVIVTIGIVALMAALTHAASKAASSGALKAKGTRMSEQGKAVQEELRASSQRAAERKPVPPVEKPPPAKKSPPKKSAKSGRKKSKRSEYMGATPGRNSKTGKAVRERMTKEGKLKTDPRSGKEIFEAEDGKWYPVDKADMGHIEPAVTWWNRKGKFSGPRSPEVKAFMKDAKNYRLEPPSINRSKGAKLGKTESYEPPVTKD